MCRHFLWTLCTVIISIIKYLIYIALISNKCSEALSIIVFLFCNDSIADSTMDSRTTPPPHGQNTPEKTPRTIPRWTKHPDRQNSPVDKTPLGKTSPNKTPRTKLPGQNPPGQNPPKQNPLDKTPRTKPPDKPPPPGQNPPGQTPPPGQNPPGQNPTGQNPTEQNPPDKTPLTKPPGNPPTLIKPHTKHPKHKQLRQNHRE